MVATLATPPAFKVTVCFPSTPPFSEVSELLVEIVPLIPVNADIVPPATAYVPAPAPLRVKVAAPCVEVSSVKLFVAPFVVDPLNVNGEELVFDWSVWNVVSPVAVEVKLVKFANFVFTLPVV